MIAICHILLPQIDAVEWIGKHITTMTKDELVEALSAKAGASKAVASELVNALVDEITAALVKGDKVALPGLGVFSVGHRKARQGVNPRTGEKLQIPAMNVAKFKAAKALKEAVR